MEKNKNTIDIDLNVNKDGVEDTVRELKEACEDRPI